MRPESETSCVQDEKPRSLQRVVTIVLYSTIAHLFVRQLEVLVDGRTVLVYIDVQDTLAQESRSDILIV